MPWLAECIEKNNLYTAQPVINLLLQKEMKCSAKLFSLLLKGRTHTFDLLFTPHAITSIGYGTLENLQMVYQTLSICISKHLKADNVLLNSAMDAFIRCNRADLAIYLFENTVLRNSGSNLFTMSVPYNDGYEMDAITAYFKRFAITPNIRTFNILIKAMRSPTQQNDHPADIFRFCFEVINLMKRYSIEPDSITVNTLIDIAVASGNLDAAEKMIGVLDYPPGVEGYTSLIAGYASKGDVRNAFRIYEAMERNNIEANAYTLSALMNGCLEAKNLKLARKLIEIGKHKYPPSVSSLYGTYLIGLCKQSWTIKDIEYASSVYEDMLSLGHALDIATINAYIQGLCEVKRDIPSALQVFYNTSGNVEPDDYTYSILFSALGKEGYLDDALQLFYRSGRYMDTPAINALLRAFLSSSEPLDAVRFFNHLANSSFTSEVFVPNKITFTILFAALLRSTKSNINTDVEGDSFVKPYLAYDDSNKRFYETSVPVNSQTLGGSRATLQQKQLPRSKYDILKFLFSSMRIKYNIEPDDVMVSTINTLFTRITKGPNSVVKFRGLQYF